MGGPQQRLTYPGEEDTGRARMVVVISYFGRILVYRDALVEFLEVAIHLILYLRNVYPAAWFDRAMKYKIPVWQSSHPGLKKYIQDILKNLRPDLEKGVVRLVYCVVVDDATKTPVEKFTFQMKSLLKSATEDVKRATLTSINSGDIEQHLKTFLLKLNTCEALLAPNPPAMDIEDTVEPSTLAAGGGDWIPADDEARVPNASMVPLKSIDTGVFKMQLFVEEGPKNT
ncbi:DNA-binding protein [Cladochytrium replicatum]|nr:DNA-binding protein [Cladochytrium replicatum]